MLALYPFRPGKSEHDDGAAVDSDNDHGASRATPDDEMPSRP
jgi:hypothetical protein